MANPDGPAQPDDGIGDEIEDERPRSALDRPPRRGGSPRRPIQLAIVALVVVLVAAAALAWRAHHRKQVIAQGLARAEALARADTAAGYRDAERLLEPLVELDPVKAGAARAYSLAMLALDQRDEAAARAAESLLVVPGRAQEVPREADVAYGLLALSRREAGTALSYAARAGDSPLAAVLHARVALLAGKPDSAREPLDRAVGAAPALPAVQALRGDVLRRTGHPSEAREAYLAALAASPTHARAVFGLSKLALGGGASAADARGPLRRLMDDAFTPAPERARAAYHLASIDARAGRTGDAEATIGRAGVEGEARAWLERAVAEQAQAPVYRVVSGAPPGLVSASDDDPPPPPVKAPLPTAISPTFRMPEPPPRHGAGPSGHATPARPPPKPVAAKAPKGARPSAKAAAKKPARDAAHSAAKKAPAKPVAAKSKTKKPPKVAAKPAPRPAQPASAGSAIDRAVEKVSGPAPAR